MNDRERLNEINDGSVQDTVGRKPRKKRKNGAVRFNWIDAVLILAVVVALGTIIGVYSGNYIVSSKKENAAIIYTVEIDGLGEEIYSALDVSRDDIVRNAKGDVIGKVESFELETSTEHNDNTGEELEYRDRKKLIITVYATVSSTEAGYFVGGVRIAVGARYDVDLPNFVGSGVCVGITEENSNGGGA